MKSSAKEQLAELSAICVRDRALISAYRTGGTGMAADEADKLAALSDAVRALTEARIPYALIGGVAVGIHSGAPRATLDVDLAGHTSTARERLTRTLEQAQFTRTGDQRQSVNFRHASSEPLRVAFDPELDAMVERAERFELGHLSVALVRRDDLIAMKERAASDPARRKSKRLRDQADIELLRGDVADPDEGW